MFDKTQITKDGILKIITAVIIASIFLLAISILTDDNDSRKQISDGNGATETALSSILSEIKGVSDVNVLVQYGKENSVTGVIVTARGADDPVIKNNILKGVSTLFDIPVSSVMVFEKSQEEKEE